MPATQKKTGTGKAKPTSAKGKAAPKSGSQSTTKRKTKPPKKPPIYREVGAVICLLLAIFSALGYFNSQAIFINGLATLEKGLFGFGFWLMPVMLLLISIKLFRHFGRPVRLQIVLCLLVPLFVGAAVHTALCEGDYALKTSVLPALWESGAALSSGGALSGMLSVLLTKVFSSVGAMILLLLGLLCCVLGLRRIGPTELVHMLNEYRAQRYREKKKKAKEKAERAAYSPDDYIQNTDPVEKLPRRPKQQPDPLPLVGDPKPAVTVTKLDIKPTPTRFPTEIDIPMASDADWKSMKEKKAVEEPKPSKETPLDAIWTPEAPTLPQDQSAEPAESAQPAQPMDAQAWEPTQAEPLSETEDFPWYGEGEDTWQDVEKTCFTPQTGSFFQERQRATPAEVRSGEREPERKWMPAGPDVDFQPEDGERTPLNEAEVTVELPSAALEEPGKYYYPPSYLLHEPAKQAEQGVTSEVIETQTLLQETIRSFGIEAQIIDYEQGPSVTRYELELKRGVKLNKVTNLAGDIALSLGAVSVRIAPIPGKNSVVGVEVPNKTTVPVPIREVIESDEFRTHPSKVAFAVGKDISGKCVVGNITKLPHLLIAGTTGSGKSVCTNSLIISLLYRATPDEVRLIMVDPKMVELSVYNGIPHLLIPVVTDPKKAAGALQWAVTEMMKRYRLFSERHVRDLEVYNKAIAEEDDPTLTKLPKIVVVIDELADLMLVAAKEVEESICRIAQMGRAAGVHLIIATQRPSSDVITGLMKANIPSRIAFAVASSLESRIILDTSGAEKLVGKGDMLYYPVGSGKPRRVQGCLIEDEEVSAVTEYIKEHFQADYSDEVIQQVEANAQANEKNGKGGKAAANEPTVESDRDEMYEDAVEVIVNTGMASVSMLQRRLKLGYSRAARLVDQMEEDGIVGPFQGSKPREVLMTKEAWQERKLRQGGDQEELAMAQAMSAAADAEADLPWTESEEDGL